MKKYISKIKMWATVCLIFCFAAWNAEANKYLKESPDDSDVLFAKERLFKGEIGPARVRDLNCPGGRGYIGTVRIPFHLGVYMGEPTYKYGFYWDWYDKSNLMVDSEHSIRLSDLRKYPNLYDRFMAMKPLNLDFTMDMLLYEKGSLIGTAEFSIKGSKWQIPITKAGEIDADLIPGSPSWNEFFRIKTSSYPDNKSLFTAADRIEFKNVKIVRIEWASADGIIHDYLNKEEEKADVERRAQAKAEEEKRVLEEKKLAEKRALEEKLVRDREKAEAEQKALEEKRLAEKKAREERLAQEKAEAERKLKEQNAAMERQRELEKRRSQEAFERERQLKKNIDDLQRSIAEVKRNELEAQRQREEAKKESDKRMEQMMREAANSRWRSTIDAINDEVRSAKTEHDQNVREIYDSAQTAISRAYSEKYSLEDQKRIIADYKNQTLTYLNQLEAEWKQTDTNLRKQFEENEAEIVRSEAEIRKQFEANEAEINRSEAEMRKQFEANEEEIARLEKESDPWNTKNKTEFSVLETGTKTTLDDLVEQLNSESQKKTVSQKGSLLKAAKSESKDAQSTEKSKKGSLLASAKKKSAEEQKGSLLKAAGKNQDSATKQKGSLLASAKTESSEESTKSKGSLLKLKDNSGNSLPEDISIGLLNETSGTALEENPLAHDARIEREKAERLKEYQSLTEENEREKTKRLKEYQSLAKENEQRKAERLKEYQALLAEVKSSRESVRTELQQTISQYDQQIAQLNDKIKSEKEWIERRQKDMERAIERENYYLELEKDAAREKMEKERQQRQKERDERRIRLRNEQRRKEIEERERIIWGNNTNLWMRR